MGWRSWVAGAVSIGAPIVGNILLPGAGGLIGAAVGGAAADAIERGGFNASSMGMSALNGLVGGASGRGISAAGKWLSKRGDDAVRTAKAANRAAKTGAPAAGRQAYTAEYRKQINNGANTVDADKRARAAQAAAQRDHIRNNTVKVPDPKQKPWGRQFENGKRGKVGANGKRTGRQRTGFGSNVLQGAGAGAFYINNRPSSGQGGGGGGGNQPNAKGGGTDGKYVGDQVQTKDGPFTRVANDDGTRGFVWQPNGISPGLKKLYSNEPAATTPA